jgi:hypothetical protein
VPVQQLQWRDIIFKSGKEWKLLKLTLAPGIVRAVVRNERLKYLCLTALAIAGICLLSPLPTSALDIQHASDRPPIVQIESGSTVDDVTIETYGEVTSDGVRRYLALRPGMAVTQSAIDHDYYTLLRLGGFRVRLVVGAGSKANTLTLHWIVMSPWFKLTAHPLYEETPLSDPTRGDGFNITSPELNKNAANAVLSTSQNRYAHHNLLTFTSPIRIDPVAGEESDFVVSVLRDQDAYRVTFPEKLTIYNWTSAAEAQYLLRWTNGIQFEAGLRAERSTGSPESGILAPSLRPTSLGAANNTIAEIGVSHACNPGPTGGWYPPYCHTQYRAALLDGIGGLGATSTFQVYSADIVQYIPVRTSTLALHAVGVRTGGVLPQSRLLCAAALRAYAEAFCGTDGQLLQAEYRFRDAAIQNIKFSIYAETGASRVRGGDQFAAPFKFQWHPDTGFEIRTHGIVVDVSRGQSGNRLNLFLTAQSF